MQTLDPLALAGTLCARLCHDLAGSLGALTGTLELAIEDSDQEAFDLALTLSREVGARLRLLRAAWGSGSEIPPPAMMLPGLPNAERLTLETTTLTATDPETLRLSLSLLLVATGGLPRGGTIRLSGPSASLAVEIEGPRAAWPEPFARCLTNDDALLEAADSPRQISIALAVLQARALARTITLHSPTHLTLAA